MVMDRRAKNRQVALVQLLLLVGILVAVNLLAANLFTRIDLTAEKRFSVSEPTKQQLRDLEDIVFVRVYLDGELTPNLVQLKQATTELLNEFSRTAKGNFEYEIYDPASIEDQNERRGYYKELAEMGMPALPFAASDKEQTTETYLFPYAEVNYRGKEPEIILLLDFMTPLSPQYDPTNAISLLEYKFARAVKELTNTGKPRIAFITGHGELDSMQVADIAYSLSEFYQLERLNLPTAARIDTAVSLAIVAHPRAEFAPSEKFKLDQFIMQGGNVLWLVEPLLSEFDSLRTGKGEFITTAYPTNLEDQLFQYGVRINKNLIQDQQAANINAPYGENYVPRKWHYSPIFTNFNPYHPITKSIDAIEGKFVSSIDTTAVKGVEKIALVRTSTSARTLPDPVRVRYNIIINPPAEEKFNQANLPVAYLLEGEFPSAFRPLKTIANQMVNAGLGYGNFIERSTPAKQIVISDGDMIRNYITPDGQVIPLGQNAIERYIFGNKDFLLNCVEYLTDNSGLMEVRAKELKLRPLDQKKVDQQRSTWQFISLAVPILILLLFAGIYNYIRLRQYGGQFQKTEEA